jgi:hypothetical protein
MKTIIKGLVLKSIVWAIYLLVFAQTCFADINVVREVVIAPKGVNAVANIGSVNSSPNVRMTEARVDITVGKPDSGPMAPLHLNVHASFELLNESSEKLELTVGFPVSNSEFSSFKLEWFRVVSDGEPREVFRRKTSYPRHLVHEYISGALGPAAAKPPSDVTPETMNLMGKQLIGSDTFQNLMVWQEHFRPNEKKTVEVKYELQIPPQKNVVLRKKTEGSYKGIWPEEANNVPANFLKTIPPDKYFYFFDYYLTTGTSWKDTIGEEVVTIHFGQTWPDHEFHASAGGKITMSGGANAGPGAPTTYYYNLRDEEPKDNLYFAVRAKSE